MAYMTNTETAIPDYTQCHTATPRTIELLFAPVVDVFDVVAVMADIHGSDAASWVFDGNTTDATYRRFARGLDDGDPEIIDRLPFLDLSGEWVDGLTPRDIIAEVVGYMGDTDPDDVDPDTADAIVNAYVAAYDMAVMNVVDRIAHEHVGTGVHDPAVTDDPTGAGWSWVANGRPETDPCQYGTPGCCVNHDHAMAPDRCETW